jgi:hypothetical protein
MDQGGRDDSLRARIEGLFSGHVSDLTSCSAFQDLETGRASREHYDRFLEALARTHLRSPQLLAFLYALAPPAATDRLLHNLLEELGVDEASRVAHPALLKTLLVAAGLGHRLPAIEALATEDIRRVVVEPLLYGTLRDLGLAALGEVVAFEFMLSRVAGRIATALATHRGLSGDALRWFHHHAEVDVRHAAEGLETLDAYIAAYEFGDDEALTLVGMALRQHVFAARYFPEAASRTGGGRS